MNKKRMKSRFSRNILFVGVWVCCMIPSFADELVKKDGEVLQGKIIEVVKGNFYRIKLLDGKIWQIKWNDVEEARFDSKTREQEQDEKKPSGLQSIAVRPSIGFFGTVMYGSLYRAEIPGILHSRGDLSTRGGVGAEFGLLLGQWFDLNLGGMVDFGGSFPNALGGQTALTIHSVYLTGRVIVPLGIRPYIGGGANYTMWTNNFGADEKGDLGSHVVAGVEIPLVKTSSATLHLVFEGGSSLNRASFTASGITVNQSVAGWFNRLVIRFLVGSD